MEQDVNSNWTNALKAGVLGLIEKSVKQWLAPLVEPDPTLMGCLRLTFSKISFRFAGVCHVTHEPQIGVELGVWAQYLGK